MKKRTKANIIKNEKINIISYFLFISLYAYLILTNIKVNSFFYVDNKIRENLLIIMLICGFIYIGKNILNRKYLKNELFIFIYTVYITTLLLIGPADFSENILLILYLPVMYYAARFVYEKIYCKNIKFDILAYIILLIFMVTYVFCRIIQAKVSLTNTIYYQLCMMPLLLRSNSKFIRNSSFIMITAFIFFSGKRVAFIAWFICSLYLLIKSAPKFKKNKQSKFIYIAIGISLIFLIILGTNYYISRNFGVSIIERMMMLNDDGGSGRDEIAKVILQELKGNSMEQHIFGHFMQSTALIPGIVGSHNDFLEIYYRSGIIGITLIVLIFIQIIKNIKITKKINYKLYCSFMCELLILLTLMMFSQSVFVATYNCIFAFEYAYCVEVARKEKEVDERV